MHMIKDKAQFVLYLSSQPVVVIDQIVIRHPPSATTSSIPVNHRHHRHHRHHHYHRHYRPPCHHRHHRFDDHLWSTATLMAIGKPSILTITIILQLSPPSITIITTVPKLFSCCSLCAMANIGIIPLLSADN